MLISLVRSALPVFVDRPINVMVRLKPDGSREIVAMTQGRFGFAVAQFGDEVPMGAEIPNVIAFPQALKPVSKKGLQQKSRQGKDPHQWRSS